MAKILHTADLHLRPENKRYAFAVLEAIVSEAVLRKADLLLIAGDLFASYKDLLALGKETAAKFAPLAAVGCEVVAITGNNDFMGGEMEAPWDDNLSPLKLVRTQPFALLEVKGVQLICVPHAADYDDYRAWAIPPRTEGVPRLLLGHGLCAELLTPPGAKPGSNAGVLPEDIFRRFGVDYAALGHHHAWLTGNLGSASACFPGTPHVYTRETGPRYMALLDTDKGFEPGQVELPVAGQYREFTLPLDPGANVNSHDADHMMLGCGPMDSVMVTLCGVVENADDARIAADQIKGRLLTKCRLAEVVTDIVTAPELTGNGAVKAFLAEIDLVKPAVDAPEFAPWAQARQCGLKALASRLGGAV